MTSEHNKHDRFVVAVSLAVRRQLAASSNRSPSGSPVSNLLSVSTQVEHPNFVNPPKAKLKQGEERTPSNERSKSRP